MQIMYKNYIIQLQNELRNKIYTTINYEFVNGLLVKFYNIKLNGRLSHHESIRYYRMGFTETV